MNYFQKLFYPLISTVIQYLTNEKKPIPQLMGELTSLKFIWSYKFYFVLFKNIIRKKIMENYTNKI